MGFEALRTWNSDLARPLSLPPLEKCIIAFAAERTIEEADENGGFP